MLFVGNVESSQSGSVSVAVIAGVVVAIVVVAAITVVVVVIFICRRRRLVKNRKFNLFVIYRLLLGWGNRLCLALCQISYD